MDITQGKIKGSPKEAKNNLGLLDGSNKLTGLKLGATYKFTKPEICTHVKKYTIILFMNSLSVLKRIGVSMIVMARLKIEICFDDHTIKI